MLSQYQIIETGFQVLIQDGLYNVKASVYTAELGCYPCTGNIFVMPTKPTTTLYTYKELIKRFCKIALELKSVYEVRICE